MNDYRKELEKTLKTISLLDKESMKVFLASPIIDTLAAVGDSKLKIKEVDSFLTPEVKFFSLVSKYGNGNEETISEYDFRKRPLKIREVVDFFDWLKKWIGMLARDSEEMEELGFEQMSFSCHKLVSGDFYVLARRMMIVKGQSIVVNTSSISKLYEDSVPMGDSVVEFLKDRLSLEQITLEQAMMLPEQLRDRILAS